MAREFLREEEHDPSFLVSKLSAAFFAQVQDVMRPFDQLKEEWLEKQKPRVDVHIKCGYQSPSRPRVKARKTKHGLRRFTSTFPETEWNVIQTDTPWKGFEKSHEEKMVVVKKRLFNSRLRDIRKYLRGAQQHQALRRALHQYHEELWYWLPDENDYPRGVMQMMEDTASEVSSQNITFEDERPTYADATHTTGSTTLPDTNACIAENNWSMKDVFTREYPVKEFEWKISDTWETPVINIGLPKGLTDNIHSLIARQLSFFAFMRAGVRVRIQLNGTKFHCGRLVAYLHPLSWENDSTVNKSSVFAYGHGFLDASVSNSVTLHFPYTHLHSYFAQRPGMIKDDSMNALGTLFVRVLNELRAGQGASQALSGTVYMALDSPEVHQPTYPISTFSYGTGFMQGLLHEAVDMAGQWTGGLVTGLGNAALNWLGVSDKPSDPMSATPIINRTCAPLCHGAGLDRSVRLGLSPVAQTDTTADIIGSTSSDFSLLTLCQVPSLIKTFEWSDTANPSTLLYSFPVTPVFVDKDFIRSTTVQQKGYVTYSPSMLAYVSRGFCYYRGDLYIKIQFISTDVHSGRVVVVFDPQGTADNNMPTFEKNKNHNLAIVDLQQKKEIVIRLPYFAVKPWLRCDHFRSTLNVDSSEASVQNKVYLDSDIMGIVRIYVLGRLVRPSIVPSTIDVNVFLYAAENFELSVPNATSNLLVSFTDEQIPHSEVRYPYCKKTDTKLCISRDYLMDLWTAGLAMYRRGSLVDPPATQDKWYNSTIGDESLDTLSWKNEVNAAIAYLIKDDPCKKLMDRFPSYKKVTSAMGESQMETISSTRDEAPTAITITHGATSGSSVAARTLSENAMNLQTVTRRYYPLYISPSLHHDYAFTVITIPVSPSFIVEMDEFLSQNTASPHRVDNLIAYFSRVFTYNRGSLRFKIIVRHPCTEVFVWHNPLEAQSFNVLSGFAPEHVAEQMSFASELAMTTIQQGVEVEVPFYSTYIQSLHRKVRHSPDLRSQNGTLYIAVRNTKVPFHVSVFISTGDDFHFNLLRSAPRVHEPWSKMYTDDNVDFAKYPELARNMQYISQNVQVPGSFAFNQAANGKIGKCDDVQKRGPLPDLSDYLNSKLKLQQDEASDVETPRVETDADLIVDTTQPPPIRPTHIPFPGSREDVTTEHMNANYIKSLIYDKQIGVTLSPGEEYAMTLYVSRHGVPQVLGLEGIQELKELVTPVVEDIRNTVPIVRDSVQQSKDAMDRMAENAQSITTTLLGFREQINNLSNRTELALDGVLAASISHRNMSDCIGMTATSVGKISDGIGFVVNTAILVTFIQNLYDLLTKEFSLGRVLNTALQACYIFEVSPMTVVTWITNIFEGSPPQANEGQSQMFGLSDVTPHEGLSAGLAILATTIYCAIFGKTPSLSYIKQLIRSVVETGEVQGLSDWLRSVHFATLGIKSVTQVYEFFSHYTDKIVSHILGKDSREVLVEREFKEKAEEVLAWINEIEQVDDDDYLEQVLQKMDCHNALFTLVDKGKEYTRDCVENKMPPSLKSVIKDANRRLDQIVQRWKAARPGIGYRYTPMSIFISGRPGTGKSEYSKILVNVVADVLQLPSANRVYSVPARDQFLSGYNGQPIVQWDDMLQNTEQDGLATEFIQWCSSVDTRVNMADLPDKGKHFKSKVLILTSNMGYPHLDVIRERIAFLRRRNIHIYMQFRDGWTRERVEALTEVNDSFEHVDFFLKHPINDQVLAYFPTRAELEKYVAIRMIGWDIKQKKAVEKFMEENGSLRMPKGVILTAKPQRSAKNWRVQRIDGEIHFVRATGDGELVIDEDPDCIGDYEVKIEPNLTEEEAIDAEIFVENLRENPEAVHAVYDLGIPQQQQNSKIKWYQLWRRKISAFKKAFATKIKSIFDKIPRLAKFLTIVSAVIGGGYLISKLLQKDSDKDKTQPEHGGACSLFDKPVTKVVTTQVAEGVSKGSSCDGPSKMGWNADTIIHAEHAVYSGNPKVTRPGFVIEGAADKSALDIARNKLFPSLAMFGWDSSGLIARLQGICIGGKLVLLPRHFFMKARDGDNFFFVRGEDKIQVEFNSQHLVLIGEKDACLYFIGARFDSRPKITNCFATEHEMQLLQREVPAILLGMTAEGVMKESPCIARANARITYPVFGGMQYMMTGWQYDVDTIQGDCGSLLVACTNKLSSPRKIIGMHTAGYSDRRGGFSVIITQEHITTAIDTLTQRFGKQVFPAPLPVEVNGNMQVFAEKVKLVPEGHFTYLGTMADNMCPSQPQKTCLRPTPFQGVIGPVSKAPALLRPAGGISPLRKALKKYGKITTPFKINHVKIVSSDILNDLLVLPHDLPAEAVSLEVAVFGLPGVPYCEKMNMNSSPGWPYQMMKAHKGQKGKAYLFGDNENPLKSEFLRTQVEGREVAAREGMRVSSIWRDCLKDELRPLEKVQAGKTRLFTIAPVDFTILVRKYFLAFEQCFYSNHSKFFSAVGINPESYNWTIAYNRLLEVGPTCIAGDFGTFDGTLFPEILFECGEIINEWYRFHGERDPEAPLVRRTLIDEVIHTPQLVQNCVYSTHQGNPSGNPLTVILNTMANAFYLRITWLEIMEEERMSLCNMIAYHEHVREEMYGDDNRLTILRTVLDIFNQITITQHLARHGIEYTDETKSGNLVPYRNLHETSFLKRKYRFDPEIGMDIALPMMDEDTVISLSNWYREGADIAEQLRANQRSALGFAFFRGRTYYDNYNFKFCQCLRNIGIKPLNLTYDELLKIFVNDIRDNGTKFIDFVGLNFT